MSNNIASKLTNEKELDEAMKVMINKLKYLEENYCLTSNEAAMILLIASICSGLISGS